MVSSEFDTLRKGSQHSSWERRADSVHGESTRASEQGLCGVLETVGGDSCLGENAALDIAGNSFRIWLWRLGFAVVVQVIWPETLQRHVRSPDVVPAFEFGAQGHQMIEALDDRHASQPFILERLDDSFCNGDGPVLPYGTDAKLDVPLFQELRKDVADKDAGLVRDHVLRWPVFSHGLVQSFDDPAGVGTFQRSNAHDLAGEMVDGHQDLDGPQPPAQDLRSVDRPDMIRMRGRDMARLGLFVRFLGRGRGCRCASRLRPLQDVPHGRGREEDTQQFQLVGNADATPTEIGLGDLQTSVAISAGVLFAGLPDGFSSSIWCSQR